MGGLGKIIHHSGPFAKMATFVKPVNDAMWIDHDNDVMDADVMMILQPTHHQYDPTELLHRLYQSTQIIRVSVKFNPPTHRS